MKSKQKFRLALSIAVMCFLTGCYIPFNNYEDDYDESYYEPDIEPSIETEPGKITAQNIDNFGKIIATDGDHVLVGSYDDIHIFRYNSSGIELIQTIEFEQTSGISSMIVYRSELIFGLADANGTGTVYVYTRNEDTWELSQKVRKGRRHDNFGCAIDIEGETMVVGANAIWSNSEGRVYVFSKNEGAWEETQEMMAEQSEQGDWFGTSVAVNGDLVLAGSPMLPLHVYKFDGTWELLRREQIGAREIAHTENNFVVIGEFFAWAFLLEADGSFSENTLNSLNKQDIAWNGEIIEMRDSLAIVATEPTNCILLKYQNRQWNPGSVFYADPGESCTFEGMAITEDQVIIGGTSYDNYPFCYVYFRDLD